jgi:hypothetical protein
MHTRRGWPRNRMSLCLNSRHRAGSWVRACGKDFSRELKTPSRRQVLQHTRNIICTWNSVQKRGIISPLLFDIQSREVQTAGRTVANNPAERYNIPLLKKVNGKNHSTSVVAKNIYYLNNVLIFPCYIRFH